MSDTLVKRGSGMVEHHPDGSTISFVSYFSFASKRLEPQRSIAIWSHYLIMTPKWRKFSERIVGSAECGGLALSSDASTVNAALLPERGAFFVG